MTPPDMFTVGIMGCLVKNKSVSVGTWKKTGKMEPEKVGNLSSNFTVCLSVLNALFVFQNVYA